MKRSAPPDLAMSQATLSALAFGGGALIIILAPVHPVIALSLAVLSVATVGLAVNGDSRMSRLADRAARLASSADCAGTVVGRLEQTISGIEALIGSIEQRLDQRNPLSGLPTREPLIAAMQQTLGDGSAGVLGLISLVDFERLNAFDPKLAEHLLLTIVERAQRMLGAGRMLAQVDRSRLAIWYDAEVPPDSARAQLEVLGYALGGAISGCGREILPEIRISTAQSPRDGHSASILLARAIAGLSHPCVAPSDIDPVEAARERYVMEQDLRRAIDRGELELQYQPLIDAVHRRVCGAEALLRWHHPVQGMIAPGRFIPIMEETGQADEIGIWVLNTACREAREWQRHGFDRLRVAVNISGHQLEKAGLPTIIERTLVRHSLSAGALEVELTETVAAGDGERAANLFRRLRDLGIAIAIDDFGTGHSSLSTLRALTFDKIKIDREFVTMVDQRQDSQAICHAIIALARGLGIRVLAEGVERADEYVWLRQHGCTHFQGYYFARPLDAAMFRTYVQDGDRLAGLLAPGFPIVSPERLSA